MLACLALFGNTVRFAQEYLSDKAAILAVNDIRRRLYDHVLHLPMRLFGLSGTSDLTSRMVQDAQALQDGFKTVIGKSIQEPINAALAFTLAMLLSWKLTLFIVLFAPVMFVGLCANFMGTAMLLGDLPPQMLHSVAGIEFAGFLWQSGRPSSFFILLISYAFTCGSFFWVFSKKYKGISMDVSSIEENPLDHIRDKPFAIISCGIFGLTIL